MSFNRPAILLGALLPALCGFVLMRSSGARQQVTPENPTIAFVWDGSVPHITDRQSYRGGAYVDATDESLMKTIILFAMDRWNSVPGSFARLVVEEGAVTIDHEDQINAIVVHDFGDKSAAAQASPNIRSLDGDHSYTIVDCDIMVSPGSSTAKYLERTIAHELGHCLGLGHSHANYKTLMGYSRTDSSSALGQDDMAGVVYLYPDPNRTHKKSGELISLDQCGVVGGHDRAVSASLLLICLLLPPCAIAWRGMKRRQS